ncbi:hypothetical protein [Rheinheimera sediminis]|uniref:hypothetical protein n=1 Tax=Rheinheimera sp. YQF-1 TaxID=2499626 RepID=UPI0016483C51|nr:hypothetical protein [Rheinheimera sp. YQF-1]
MRIELQLFLSRFNSLEVISVLLTLPILLQLQPTDIPLWACTIWLARPSAEVDS